jgi:hypothetical protein
MNISDRLVGSPSRRRIEQFHKARLVRIARWGFAIWLDPFGMLDPQVVVQGATYYQSIGSRKRLFD